MSTEAIATSTRALAVDAVHLVVVEEARERWGARNHFYRLLWRHGFR